MRSESEIEIELELEVARILKSSVDVYNKLAKLHNKPKAKVYIGEEQDSVCPGTIAPIFVLAGFLSVVAHIVEFVAFLITK